MVFFRRITCFGWGFTGLAIVSAILLSSCMKKESFPVVPEIAYKGFYLEYDSSQYAKRGFLAITFQDGDGDIGLRPNQKEPPFDTGSIYYYNYIIDYYERQNGKFVKIVLDPPYHARIPWLTPNDANKSIKGIILDTLMMNPVPVYDTIMFKFWIYDRALHQSNVDSTPPIILKKR